ncbi:uncharacterized protein LOC110861539 isoform X2 [Folsomia candida]|uniref:uncharacterized protein LOC110861539 isoform X2 n=1 Tax=Folsomia candida TaxID=158441 RepID=UPI000B8F8230|nr:uncharacterized protein LOC110861539 isoform X2 [Folsomia candida]
MGEEEVISSELPTRLHPLLNDVVLDTLVTYISPNDLAHVRKTCSKWAHYSAPRFRQEYTVDLSGNCITAVSRKVARFIYAMPSDSPLPFDSFNMSEMRLGVGSLDRTFMTHIVPRIRRLRLVTRNRSSLALHHFWKLIQGLEELEELELGLPPEITSSSPAAEIERIRLTKVSRVKWLSSNLDVDEDEENVGIIYGTEFLSTFYKAVTCSLQKLELPRIEAWRHLQAIGTLGDLCRLNSVQFSTLRRQDLEVLEKMCESKELQLQLSEFISSAIASDIQSGLLERILCYQSGSLKTLKIGWTEEQDRGDVLEISFPQNFPKLRVLSLKLANNQRYQPICFEEKFPSLKELCVKVKETGNRGRIYFWEDLIQKPVQLSTKKVHLLWKLELIGVPLRFPESLYDLMMTFPNVQSLTLGRPLKKTLTALWSTWPQLKELKIISACPQIDEVLTGIPTPICRRILIDRDFNQDLDTKEGGILYPYLDGSVPSIRDLKYLERFEMNGRLNCKLQTLSCLPSDVAVYFGFMQMPELKNILIHRSLISGEASFELQRCLPPWGTVKVEQIKFEFDETIDAFQFHKNNQQLMKLLCRYPNQSLQNLPSFLTSLWIEGRLDL